MSCRHLNARLSRAWGLNSPVWCQDCRKDVSCAEVINGNLDEMRDAIAELRRDKQPQFSGPFFSNVFPAMIPTPQKPGHPLGKCVKHSEIMCNGPTATTVGSCGGCDMAAWQTVSFVPFRQVP